ncbi:Hsp20 family protein [Methanosalsum natronophilum]|uniref:Uncharacterized protein n=1 Tax=Methanosalsum natronophilum TaxID=768733 RepID=A0A3R7VZ42_9EURY|nr:Hsp20 family protein [Methanosalsum natronophilum]MCS3923939.1 HSP20 family protein [Methanosalsum natronophilum]RQD91101.1 MAG: hypothetical protein D5R95_01310 [Methanosalsum natronophilum]
MVDKRRRPFDENGNNFGGEHIENIEQLINYISTIFEDNSNGPPDKPLVYGFTIIQTPGKKPEILGFKGALPDLTKIQGSQQIWIGQKEPYVDIIEDDNNLYVLIDIGTEELNLDYSLNEDRIELVSFEEHSNYRKEIELPRKINPDSLSETFKNGVLEITLEISENTY